MKAVLATIGQRGTLVIPAAIRQRLGIETGSLLILEVMADGSMIVRPAQAMPVETYSPEREASFLLNDARDAAGYAKARKLVEKMGLDPDRIPHDRPAPKAKGVP